MKARDFTGVSFGRLTVLGEGNRKKSASGKSTYRMWICRCSCGTIKSVIQSCLLSKRPTTSCGCFQREDVTRRQLVSGRDDETRAMLKVYRVYKHKCKVSGMDFSLPQDDFLEMMKMDCFYCGSGPIGTSKFSPETKVFLREAEIRYNGLDRVNSSLGYTPDNVVPCCKICNIAKRAMSVERFSEWVDRIHSHKNKTHWLRSIGAATA